MSVYIIMIACSIEHMPIASAFTTLVQINYFDLICDVFESRIESY